MADRQLLFTTPIALFLGCCVIAAAVFFGLRARHGREPARQPSANPERSARVAPIATSGGPEQRPRPIMKRQAVAAAAHSAVAARKSAWLATCWQPALATNPEPARMVVELDLSFDAEGTQIARGLIEQRGLTRADVAQCLRRQPMDLRIPAPGTRVRTTVRVEFP